MLHCVTYKLKLLTFDVGCRLPSGHKNRRHSCKPLPGNAFQIFSQTSSCQFCRLLVILLIPRPSSPFEYPFHLNGGGGFGVFVGMAFYRSGYNIYLITNIRIRFHFVNRPISVLVCGCTERERFNPFFFFFCRVGHGLWWRAHFHKEALHSIASKRI